MIVLNLAKPHTHSSITNILITEVVAWWFLGGLLALFLSLILVFFCGEKTDNDDDDDDMIRDRSSFPSSRKRVVRAAVGDVVYLTNPVERDTYVMKEIDVDEWDEVNLIVG